MGAKQAVAWFALALCLSACDASTTPPANAAKEPMPAQGATLQALVAKTKKNLVFVEGGTFQMGDFGMVHSQFSEQDAIAGRNFNF